MVLADTVHGKFYYFLFDDIGKRIASGEFFDVHIRPYMDRLNEGDVLVDIGANIGFFTIYAAAQRLVQVIAFEASPEVFDLLERNVQENGVGDRVQLHCQALYDSTCYLKMNPEWNDWPRLPSGRVDYENHCNSGGLSLVPAFADEEVPTFFALPLDHLNLQKVNLLKVDAQGSDLRILVGATETLKRCRPVVCFEFECSNRTGKNAGGDSLDDFYTFFESLQYRVNKIWQGDSSQDFVAEPI